MTIEVPRNTYIVLSFIFAHSLASKQRSLRAQRGCLTPYRLQLRRGDRTHAACRFQPDLTLHVFKRGSNHVIDKLKLNVLVVSSQSYYLIVCFYLSRYLYKHAVVAADSSTLSPIMSNPEGITVEEAILEAISDSDPELPNQMSEVAHRRFTDTEESD